MKYVIKKHVTLPLLKIKPNGAPAFVRFEGAMHLGERIKGAATEGTKAAKMEPATLAHVLDLTTGEEMQIICPLLLRERLSENYPKDSYVGKQFRITLTREEGKKYNLVGLQEIEVDPDDIGTPGVATLEAPDKPVAQTAGEVAAAARATKATKKK